MMAVAVFEVPLGVVAEAVSIAVTLRLVAAGNGPTVDTEFVEQL
jgi:hypothetical protein